MNNFGDEQNGGMFEADNNDQNVQRRRDSEPRGHTSDRDNYAAADDDVQPPAQKKSRIEGALCRYFVVTVSDNLLAGQAIDNCSVDWDNGAGLPSSGNPSQRTMVILSVSSRQSFAAYGVYLAAKSEGTTPSTVKVGWVRVATVPWGPIASDEVRSQQPGRAWVKLDDDQGRQLCDAIDDASLSVLPTDLKILHQYPDGAAAAALRSSWTIRSAQRGRGGPMQGRGGSSYQPHEYRQQQAPSQSGYQMHQQHPLHQQQQPYQPQPQGGYQPQGGGGYQGQPPYHMQQQYNSYQQQGGYQQGYPGHHHQQGGYQQPPQGGGGYQGQLQSHQQGYQGQHAYQANPQSYPQTSAAQHQQQWQAWPPTPALLAGGSAHQQQPLSYAYENRTDQTDSYDQR